MRKKERERERDGQGVEKGDEKERGDDWVGEREGQCRRRKESKGCELGRGKLMFECLESVKLLQREREKELEREREIF